MLVPLLLLLALPPTLSLSHQAQLHRRHAEHARYKRQFGGQLPPNQIDLNITVPFIFSARLYPYGPTHGDNLLTGDFQKYRLSTPLRYFTETHSDLYVLRDGVIGLDADVGALNRKQAFPRGKKSIAPFWAPTSLGKTGRVWFRESKDLNTVRLAASEVSLQYKYPDNFKVESVFVVTWENVAPAGSPDDFPDEERNLFQISLILSNNGSFAHTVYSKLRWHDFAVAGFNEGEGGSQYTLPGSGTPDGVLLANQSDIGIPGEWIFRIDTPDVFLCGPGFKGIECIDKCAAGEYYYDCSRRCHCAEQRSCCADQNSPTACNCACDVNDGTCSTTECQQGWTNLPTCDIDVDECEVDGAEVLCPAAQPDCINTPGAYLCMCLAGFDNTTNLCRGAENLENRPPPEAVSANPIPPRVNTPLSIVPVLIGNLPVRSRVTAQTPPSPPPAPRTILPVRAAAFPFLAQTTTLAPFFGFGDDYEYDYEPLPVATRRASVATQAPFTPPTFRPPRHSTPRPVARGGVVTPLIITERPCTLVCGPNAQCAVTHAGDMRCICQDGFTSEGELCVDADECGKNPCGPNSECHNEPGGYVCMCQPGYQSQANACVDVDECETGEANCPGAETSVCVNTLGSFECRCKPGFNGNPGSILGCIDINECLIPEFYCGPNADCENTAGGFRCHCVQGFERDPSGSGCLDIDECTKAPCDPAAVCVNRDGAFECRCLNGYAGDGFSCSVDSVVEVNLNRPLRVFGADYDRIYISANGMVSFDAPLRQYRDEPLRDMGMVALAPLYARADLPSRGAIVFRESTEYSSVTRGSLNVQEDFHMPDFRASSVFIVTFVDLLPPGVTAQKGNTYQLVLVSGEAGTYATYIYDSLVSTDVQAGVTDGGEAATLPGEILRSSSNIGQPGKWMFRIDREEGIGACPAGLTGAPLCRQSCELGTWGEDCLEVCRCGGGIPCDFVSGVCANSQCQPGFRGFDCQQDVDECLEGIAGCDENAQCVNGPGTFTCTCYEGFEGDGATCHAVDVCLTRYGVPCAGNAECRMDITGLPLCVCLEPYEGDGFSCEEAMIGPQLPPIGVPAPPSVNEVTPPPTPRPTPPATNPPTPPLTPPPTTPFVFTQPPQPQTPAWTQPRTPPTTPRFIIDNRVTAGPPTPRPRTVGPVRETPGPNTIDEFNNLLIAGEDYESSTNSNLLVIIIPAVLCGVWLILIIILLVVCLRRRKQRQRDKFGLGYYLPPPSSSKAAPANYSSYSSQWTIPRPAPVDYSQYAGTSSYSSYHDPYAQYKY